MPAFPGSRWSVCELIPAMSLQATAAWICGCARLSRILCLSETGNKKGTALNVDIQVPPAGPPMKQQHQKALAEFVSVAKFMVKHGISIERSVLWLLATAPVFALTLLVTGPGLEALVTQLLMASGFCAYCGARIELHRRRVLSCPWAHG